MAKFESEYDIGEVGLTANGSKLTVVAVKFKHGQVIYETSDSEGRCFYDVREPDLKPAPKEMFVAVFDSGVCGIPLPSIEKVDYNYANTTSSPYKIMKLVDIEE